MHQFRFPWQSTSPQQPSSAWDQLGEVAPRWEPALRLLPVLVWPPAASQTSQILTVSAELPIPATHPHSLWCPGVRDEALTLWEGR